MVVVFVFFFKQKTAYEMRISDWSSDVCSSDLNLESLSREELAAHLKVARRAHAVARARENLLPFIKITMPDPERYDDPQASAYRDVAHHRLLCEAFEKVESGECLRLAVSIPPQHGK